MVGKKKLEVEYIVRRLLEWVIWKLRVEKKVDNNWILDLFEGRVNRVFCLVE